MSSIIGDEMAIAAELPYEPYGIDVVFQKPIQ